MSLFPWGLLSGTDAHNRKDFSLTTLNNPFAMLRFNPSSKRLIINADIECTPFLGDNESLPRHHSVREFAGSELVALLLPQSVT